MIDHSLRLDDKQVFVKFVWYVFNIFKLKEYSVSFAAQRETVILKNLQVIK